jgi:uncharacterized protein
VPFDSTFIALGALVGLLVGLTGIGGGALLTPLLILVAGVRPTVAIGTDLAFAAVTKLVGAVIHLRRGSADLGLVVRLGIGSVPGAIIGSQLVGVLERATGSAAEDILAHALAIALLLAAGASLVRATGVHWTLHTETPGLVVAPLLGLVVGVLVGMTSIGAGSLLMGVLALLYGLAATRSVGADVVHGALLAAVAALMHASEGRVEPGVLIPLLVGSVPGVVVGSLLCGWVPGRPLRVGVAALLVITALRLL